MEITINKDWEDIVLSSEQWYINDTDMYYNILMNWIVIQTQRFNPIWEWYSPITIDNIDSLINTSINQIKDSILN